LFLQNVKRFLNYILLELGKPYSSWSPLWEPQMQTLNYFIPHSRNVYCAYQQIMSKN
jgi:hypothetical protein